jgi:hypothetical protein
MVENKVREAYGLPVDTPSEGEAAPDAAAEDETSDEE